MKILLLTFLLFAVAVSTAQTKYMIYFKDKGISSTARLQKSSGLFKAAEKELSAKAVERRKQVMGEDNYIRYEDIPLNESYIGQLESIGIKIENKLKWFNAVSAYLTDDQLNSIKSLQSVQKVEKVRVFRARNDEGKLNESPADVSDAKLNKTSSVTGLNYGYATTQNNLSDIPAVHDIGVKGTGVYVGILDNGFSWQAHNSLINLHVLKEYDYVEKDNNTQNQSGHGQAVFSIMAGYDPGNLIGPAYDANFFLAKTENDASETKVEEDNYAAALQDMENAGVQITSSSLGYNTFNDPSTSYTFANMDGNTTISAKALNLAFDFGVSTFTAAGNERGNSWNHILTPADAFNVIAVGAVTSTNLISSFSSPGPTSDGRIKPEVAAMGTSVYHANTAGFYSAGNGTSYATPIAAGIAALLKSAWPHLTNIQIRKIFLECGDNTLSPNNDRGWGLISAKKAVSYPNLSKSGSIYNVLNKIFIDANGVNTSSVRLNYKIGTGSFQTVPMNSVAFNNTYKYNYQLPAAQAGSNIEFYFTYQTAGGMTVREPVSPKNYKFSYGTEIISGVDESENRGEIPAEFSLSQNYPNPFNPSTIISYQLSSPGKVTLKVYDMLGREVATLVNEFQSAGSYVKTMHASSLPSGVYFYRLQTDNFSAAKKMLLIK